VDPPSSLLHFTPLNLYIFLVSELIHINVPGEASTQDFAPGSAV